MASHNSKSVIDAVGQRADDRNRVGRAALHLPAQVSHGSRRKELRGALFDGHDRGLVQHQTFADNADQGVGGPQIDRQIGTEII